MAIKAVLGKSVTKVGKRGIPVGERKNGGLA